jgi:hypothetical protein
LNFRLKSAQAGGERGGGGACTMNEVQLRLGARAALGRFFLNGLFRLKFYGKMEKIVSFNTTVI